MKISQILMVNLVLFGVFQAFGMKQAIKPVMRKLGTLKPFKRDLHIDHIKHLYNGLDGRYKHLSPVHGAALEESGWLQRFYKFGNPNHSLVKLVADEKQGLFHLRENQFRPTQNKSLPGASLNARVLANILGTLETNNFSNKSVKNDIATQWRLAHKQTFDDRISGTKVHNILDLIGAAHEESNPASANRLYLPHTTQSILLGFLYRKADKKEEVLEYLQGLQKHIPILSKDIPLHDNYTNNDLAEYIYRLGYEETVYSLIKIKKYQNVNPPFLIQRSYSFQNQRETPDCVETAFRGILYWLFSNQKTPNIDFSMIPAANTMRQDFKEYFTTYGNFASVNTKEAGQAWMNLTAGHSFLKYGYPNKTDLEARVSNLIGLFNYIFSINAQNLDQLGEKLSTPNRRVFFSPSKKADNVIGCIDNDTDVKITIGDNNLLLTARPSHGALLTPPGAASAKNIITTRELLRKYTQNNQECRHLLSLVACGKVYIDDLHGLSSYDKLMHFYCSVSDLEEPNTLLSMCVNALEKVRKSPELLPTIKKYMQALPLNDDHFASNIARAIGHGRVYELDPCFAEFITKNQTTMEKALEGLFNYIDHNREYNTSFKSKLEDMIGNLLPSGSMQNKQELFYTIISAFNNKYDSEIIDRTIFDALLPLKDTIARDWSIDEIRVCFDALLLARGLRPLPFRKENYTGIWHNINRIPILNLMLQATDSIQNNPKLIIRLALAHPEQIIREECKKILNANKIPITLWDRMTSYQAGIKNLVYRV